MEKIQTTIRVPKKLHDYIMSEIKWKEKKSFGKLVIESLTTYLKDKGYKLPLDK